ncbi:MAG: phospholipase A [Chitinophagaceae bacterium]|nr:phospholipase A [Chitinophagaceae bacterium]
MAERWELERQYHKGVFVITPYKPVYVTAGRYSDNPNKQPISENPAYSESTPVNYNNYEAKFQFSLKTKIIYGMFHDHADLWVAYTQKAHWQIYNTELSRPFRELNYEPEVIMNFPVRFSLFGLTCRMAGVSFNHQSNGRELPLSRSWNRLIGYAGFEKNNFQMTLRGWYRLPDEDDENPLVADYVGRGEGVFVYNVKRHQFSLVATSGLRPKYPGRGSVQFNWVFPVINNFRMQVQVSDGYGETLVDYNHKQFTAGISAALIDW